MIDDMVRVSNLRIKRPDFEVNEITFHISRGSVVGLVGPNGAGKTTLIRSVLGLQRPHSGQIEVFGQTAGSAAP